MNEKQRQKIESWARASVLTFGIILAVLTVVVLVPVPAQGASLVLLILSIPLLCAGTIVVVVESYRRLPRRVGRDKWVEITEGKPEAPPIGLAPTAPEVEYSGEKPALATGGLQLLERMLHGECVEYHPVIDLVSKAGYGYPSVNGLLDASDTNGMGTVEILESLAKGHILEKQYSQTLFCCPKCGAFVIQLSLRCPKCDHSRLARCRVLEHFACAHVGPEETFATLKGYSCPKCRKELHTIGVDYRSLGVHHKCQRCGGLSGTPTEEYHCLRCQAYFPKYEAGEVVLYSYTFDESHRGTIEAEIKPKKRLVESLSRAGYTVQSPAKVIGNSTVEHEIDIYATKGCNGLEQKLAIGITCDEKGVSATEVLRLHAKAFDTGTPNAVLIAIPKIASEAIPLAIQYNVRLIEANHLDGAVEEFILEAM